MCLFATPQLLLFTTVASGVSGMMSARAGAKEALRAGQRTAERIEQQKQVAQLTAEQETTALLQGFTQSMASNIAMRGIMEEMQVIHHLEHLKKVTLLHLKLT